MLVLDLVCIILRIVLLLLPFSVGGSAGLQVAVNQLFRKFFPRFPCRRVVAFSFNLELRSFPDPSVIPRILDRPTIAFAVIPFQVFGCGLQFFLWVLSFRSVAFFTVRVGAHPTRLLFTGSTTSSRWMMNFQVVLCSTGIGPSVCPTNFSFPFPSWKSDQTSPSTLLIAFPRHSLGSKLFLYMSCAFSVLPGLGPQVLPSSGPRLSFLSTPFYEIRQYLHI